MRGAFLIVVKPNIQLALSTETIRRCFPIMAELRPHLTMDDFIGRVQGQQEKGYHLAFLEEGGEVRALAGYRVLENLAWGRFLYVDDLVTRSLDHGNGFGSALFDWLTAEAISADCRQLHLDSGVQRFGAHRFYLHKGMDITSHHFALSLLSK